MQTFKLHTKTTLLSSVIIVAMLVQAIQAGIKYKRLLPQLQMAG